MQNKQGQLQFLIIPVVIAVIALIAVISFLSSWTMRLTIVGAALLGVTLIYVLPAWYSGGAKKNGRGILFVLLGIGVVLILAPYMVQQSYSVGSSVLLPIYSNVYCAQLPTVASQDFVLTSKEQTFHCGTGTGIGNVNAYVPDGCNYILKKDMSYKVCDESQDCSLGFWGTFVNGYSNAIIHINQGQKVTFYAGLLANPTNYPLTVQFQAWGLRYADGTGKLIFTQNCDIRSLGLDYITSKRDTSRTVDGYVLLRDGYITNYIVGSTAIYSAKNVITKNDKLIYIYAPGQYYNILTSAEGQLYADSSAPKTDNSIVCMPSTTYCKDDGSGIIQEPSTKTCSALSGNVEGYLQAGANSECKYTCVNGALVKGTCRTIVQCTADKPVLNSATGQCEAAGIPSNGDLKCTAWYQEQGITTTYKYNILGIKFGAVDSPVCKTASWVYIAGLMVMILLIVLMVLLLSPKPQRKSK